MLLGLFNEMRAAKVPVSVRELLDLINALKHHVVFADMDEFYYLARTVMVKDERHFDKFDRAFGAYFKGLENLDQLIEAMIPDDWLRKEFERMLSDEEKAKIESLGGLDKLIEEFKKRLEEQKERHEGGNKWVGTGGTSPFGSGGYNPEGIRVGDAGKRQGRAAKVWDQREYKNLDDQVELGTRNIKVALRRLRKFARQGAADELDIDGTIDHTAKDAGLLNIQMRPERRNAVKLLLLFDIGGSMDAHIKVCEELFSACRTEFKHLEYYYFHNCVYESVWKNNMRRTSERTSTIDLLHKYGPDYKVIFVGDAAMAPYEITQPGGSVEHWNEEAGHVWIQRFKEKYKKLIWINPYPKDAWEYTTSTQIMRDLIEDKMYPLTLQGLEDGMRHLSK
ncbi:vWA domain-containing protein [Pseudomonas neustonica]|uniref:VWA domain-containing protein n=1 Tax=Pseudomonas neustonica TaxID=2487346 RepID=A0ABX9XFA2_9PSED|nr:MULTISPECIES: VWA domain-containing protein [Pseudomonas]MBA6419531.1 VWA domain-containing protein [Pseudomonas sp. 5Ae-yellow]ROZ82535.1 VWA domain-containing protein [Pseudomonas neustonica]ROZ82606.1 VWA domain-containing protein [Pseudomonas sp. SSM44]|tara:strand:+ start:1157 stop:2335 length:1179 start_codon:yes stop_codon:yes gene_type:complete